MKYKRQKQIKQYDALGFVEALIAILVAGIASIFLMGIASETIKQLSKNEIEDEMTQAAIEIGAQVKAIAYRNTNETEISFPKISESVNACFSITGTSDQPEFAKDDLGNFTVSCNYDSGERESCKNAALQSNDDLFGVFCITSASESSTGLIVGKAIVGRRVCTNSADCVPSDYSYYVLTKTTQK